MAWRRLRGDLSNAYKYFKGECQEDGARLFSVMRSNRTRSNGHKPQHRNFHLSTRKNFFTVRMTERALGQAAWRGCGLSFSGDI